jgi:hypothetical protein
MRRFLVHFVFIAIALAITLAAFNFWGKFSGAMGNLYADKPKPVAKPTGEVTMTIIQPGAKPDCDKKHPCP